MPFLLFSNKSGLLAMFRGKLNLSPKLPITLLSAVSSAPYLHVFDRDRKWPSSDGIKSDFYPISLLTLLGSHLKSIFFPLKRKLLIRAARYHLRRLFFIDNDLRK